MTFLDPISLASNTALQKDNPTYGSNECKYEYLLKDVPCHKKGFPYIKVCGYSEMIISVGSLANSRSNPVELLQEKTDYVRSIQDCKFEVTAEFKTGHWPLGLGFQRLGEFLAFLGDKEIGYECWHKLIISLPDLELPCDMLSLQSIPLDVFANLRHLTWRGHRKQLLASWLPLLPSILQSLTTLEIQCDIALRDCCHLLYYGSNLKEVTLKIIQRNLAHEPVLGFMTPPGCASRPLEYLCLVSDEDIGPLLCPFSFPSLRHISFTLGYPTWPNFADLQIWKTLEIIDIISNLSENDCDWIRSQCNPTTQCNFMRLGRLVKGARSFLHNDSFHKPFSLFYY